MAKKKEKAFQTAEEEVKFLRKQISGLKGQNSLLTAQRNDLNKCIDSLRDELHSTDDVTDKLEMKVKYLEDRIDEREAYINELCDKFGILEANVEYYESKPWFVKMFTFKIR